MATFKMIHVEFQVELQVDLVMLQAPAAREVHTVRAQAEALSMQTWQSAAALFEEKERRREKRLSKADAKRKAASERSERSVSSKNTAGD